MILRMNNTVTLCVTHYLRYVRILCMCGIYPLTLWLAAAWACMYVCIAWTQVRDMQYSFSLAPRFKNHTRVLLKKLDNVPKNRRLSWPDVGTVVWTNFDTTHPVQSCYYYELLSLEQRCCASTSPALNVSYLLIVARPPPLLACAWHWLTLNYNAPRVLYLKEL